MARCTRAPCSANSRRRGAGRYTIYPTCRPRLQAVSTLVPPPPPRALHSVALARTLENVLAKLETLVLWSSCPSPIPRLCWAKEIVFFVLVSGHRISPLMHVRYEHIVCLARVARSRRDPCFCASNLGMRAPAARRWPTGPGLPHAPHFGLVSQGRLVVSRCSRADGAPADGAETRAAHQAARVGGTLLPSGASTRSEPAGDLRGGLRRRRGHGLPRGASGSLH